MTQFYIVEVKELFNGEFEHQVYWVWDEDTDKARLKAEAKFHEVLAVAATSETKAHSAIMFSTEGFPLRNECYKHEHVPEEPEIPEEPIEEEPAEEPSEVEGE